MIGHVKLNKPPTPQPFYFGESNVPFILGLRKQKRERKQKKMPLKIESNEVKVVHKNKLRTLFDATNKAESFALNYHNQYTV